MWAASLRFPFFSCCLFVVILTGGRLWSQSCAAAAQAADAKEPHLSEQRTSNMGSWELERVADPESNRLERPSDSVHKLSSSSSPLSHAYVWQTPNRQRFGQLNYNISTSTSCSHAKSWTNPWVAHVWAGPKAAQHSEGLGNWTTFESLPTQHETGFVVTKLTGLIAC